MEWKEDIGYKRMPNQLFAETRDITAVRLTILINL